MGIFILRSASAPPAGGESWQLAAGHFVSAKMAPVIIHPRPDAEMGAFARAARCPSAIEWSIPIVVRGGAWPFKYELLQAPSGATITETVPSDWLTNGLQDYGVVTWANPTVGNHTFEVKVTDQDGTEVTRTWTLEVISRENTTYFMFLDASGGSNANSGAYSSPKQTIAGMYGSNKADSTNAAKQIFYRSGAYNVTDSPVMGGSGQQVDMTSSKAHVHVGFPGETATLNSANTAYWDWESGNGDLCYADLTFTGPTVSESSAVRKQFIRAVTNSVERALIFRNHFIGNDDVAANNSNSSCVMFSGNPGPENYFSIIQNTFDNCDEMDFVLFYDTSDVVCEGNRIVNGYTADEAWGFFFKANTIERVTVRANVGISAGIACPLIYFSQFVPTASDVRNDIEVCWNSYKSTSSEIGAAGAGCVGIGQGDGTNGNHYGNFWSYRNNWHNPHIAMVGIGDVAAGPFEFQNDVIHHSGAYADGIYELALDVTPVKTNLATGTGMLDSSTNLLTGAARSTYLGTHGCEIA